MTTLHQSAKGIAGTGRCAHDNMSAVEIAQRRYIFDVVLYEGTMHSATK